MMRLSMNTLTPLIAAVALVSAASAAAQSQARAPDQTGAVPPPSATAPPVDQQQSAQAAGAYGANTSATGPVPADQMPPGQAAALAAGDNRLLTNGPIPDTPANRAKYGGPMSNAGKRTAPAGN